jgi:hypothetical protein
VDFDDGDRSAEAERLLELCYRLSALVADEYAVVDTTAVVQDNIYGADVAAWIDSLPAGPVRLVVRPGSRIDPRELRLWLDTVTRRASQPARPSRRSTNDDDLPISTYPCPPDTRTGARTAVSVIHRRPGCARERTS